MNDLKKIVVEKKILVPFILITSLFALWGFANDITNPMVAAFKTVMEISNAKAAMVQFAFYGGYATMAIPAALVIKRYSYKVGIIIGLALYAVGALLFFPAAQFEIFGFFLVSLYILTFGLAFLETTANPYILSMGDPATATRRLNLAQSFNPMGSILGMFVASKLILSSLESDKRDAIGNLVFDLLKEESEACVRAVLGHFIFVYIHPYMDGNGRIGRFLFNAMLASGGYSWATIPVERRRDYMAALEQASVNGDITAFAQFLGKLVKE